MSSQKIEFSKAQKASEAGRSKEALVHYRKVIARNDNSPQAIQAAKEAARISHFELKDFKQALEFYRHLVLYAPLEKERIEAQRQIAEINLKQLTDYSQAILEYNRLLELPHEKSDEFAYHLAVSQSYFYLNNFYQALVEVDALLRQAPSKEFAFDPMLLKANILLNMNRPDDAIALFKELLEKYPERAKKESVGLQLAVCYEEKRDFAKAIETLEQIKDSYPTPEFIELRIKRLKERESYLPGAKGLKK